MHGPSQQKISQGQHCKPPFATQRKNLNNGACIGKAGTTSEAILALAQARQAALEAGPLDLPTPQLVRKTAKSFSPDTKLGFDQWAFTEIAALSDEALEALCQLLAFCEASVAWPSQGRAAMLVLKAKPTGAIAP